MIDIITNNPYRILGVFANASQREIAANKAKMNAFMRVGKKISFPTDAVSLLGNIDRTTDTMTDADSRISLEAGKLRAAQFWFVKKDPLDEMAVKQLSEGNIDKAVETWSKRTNMTSLQNLAVCYLIKEDVSKATVCLSKLYDGYREEFLSAIGVGEVSVEDLVGGYISAMLEANPHIDVSLLINDNCSSSWKNAAKEQMIQPIIKQLNDAISKAKSRKGKSTADSLDAGRKLVKSSKKLLMRLRRLLPTDDIQMVSISDKVGNEILSCAIAYFNASYTPRAAVEALELHKEAEKIVLGSMAKQRCKENGDILRSHLINLPSQDVEEEARIIDEALAKYRSMSSKVSSANRLINMTQKAIADIREKKGASDAFYLQRSSNIVNEAINYMVSDVNSTQEEFNEAPQGSQREKDAYEAYRTAVSVAWSLMQRLEKWDMNATTRERLNTNKKTLENLKQQIDSYKTPVDEGPGCLSSLMGYVFALLIRLGGIALFCLLCGLLAAACDSCS